jgi:hypothetical protein
MKFLKICLKKNIWTVRNVELKMRMREMKEGRSEWRNGVNLNLVKRERIIGKERKNIMHNRKWWEVTIGGKSLLFLTLLIFSFQVNFF